MATSKRDSSIFGAALFALIGTLFAARAVLCLLLLRP